jgi:hypothetical protein
MENDALKNGQTAVIVLPADRKQAHPLMESTILPACPGDPPLTTWCLDDAAGRIKLQNVLVGETVSLWDLCDKEGWNFLCTDVCVRFASRIVDEATGETKDGPLIYLVGPEGVFTTSSPSAYRALALVQAVGFSAPWNPPMQLEARRNRSRNKREFLTIICHGPLTQKKE